MEDRAAHGAHRAETPARSPPHPTAPHHTEPTAAPWLKGDGRTLEPSGLRAGGRREPSFDARQVTLLGSHQQLVPRPWSALLPSQTHSGTLSLMETPELDRSLTTANTGALGTACTAVRPASVASRLWICVVPPSGTCPSHRGPRVRGTRAGTSQHREERTRAPQSCVPVPSLQTSSLAVTGTHETSHSTAPELLTDLTL